MQIKLKKYLLVILVTFSFTTVKAGVTSLKEIMNTSDIYAGAIMAVNEPDAMENPTQVLAKRENIVRLVYSRDEQTDLNNGSIWTYKVNYKIYQGATAPITDFVEISFSNNQPIYEDIKVYTNGYQYAKVEIIDVEITTPNGAAIPADIRLELETQSTRYYGFSSVSSSCNALYQTMLTDVSPGGYLYDQPALYPLPSFWQAVENAMFTPPYLTFYNPNAVIGHASDVADPVKFLSSFAYQLVKFHPNYSQYITCSSAFDVFFDQPTNTVNWGFIVGAEEYDLEYVFIDKKVDGVVRPTTAIAAFNYKEPTRVSTTGNSYQMDMTFPAGDIYFRVRAVGRYLNDIQTNFANLKLGDWNYTDVYVINTSFETTFNWQFLNTFAEDGKHKSVISYFDGSFRNRQQQTNLSTSNITVVGETKYDHEGRGVVSILPVPKQNNTLTYEKGFNKDLTTGNPFDKTYFDEGVHAKLSTTSGAGQYYSANNPFTNDLYRDYIPNADGYAYSQVEYTRDNTGRISRSSGVGETHKLKDAGSGTSTKESRYFYGTTNSTELHRMFGKNVGKASHYKKNMAIDANGQVSLSYLDQEGRTIATSLAGDSPDNLIPLESNAPEPVTINLNDNNIIDFNNNVSTNSSSILNVTEGINYSFSYDLTGVIYNSAIEGNPAGTTPGCIDCVYELEISITDPDGLKILLTGVTSGVYDPITKTITQTFSNPGSTTCPDEYTPSPISFSAQFADFGNYTITKKLKISDANLQAELEAAIEEAGLGSSYLAGLIEQAQGSIDWSLCDVTCEQHCMSQVLADNPTLDPNNSTHATIIQGLVDDCINTTCQQSIDNALAQDECEAIKQVMIADLSLGGDLYTGIYVDFSAMDNTTLLDYLDANHPGYCHYETCTNANMKLSKEYDRKQALITDWDEAIGTGFDNPLVTQNQDPIVNFFTGQALTDFTNAVSTTNYNGSGLTLVAFVDIANNSISHLYDDQYGVQLSLNTAQEKEYKWTFYRGFYQKIKVQALIDYNTSINCNYSDISILQEPQVLNTIEEIQLALQVAIADFQVDCGDVCTNNVAYWMSLLNQSGCFTAAPTCRTMEENVEILLYNYCVAKCGIDNPFAAIVNDGSAEFTQLQADFAAATSCYSCDLGLITSNPYGTCENAEYYETNPPSYCFLEQLNYFNNEVFPSLTAPNSTYFQTVSPGYNDFFDNCFFNEVSVSVYGTDYINYTNNIAGCGVSFVNELGYRVSPQSIEFLYSPEYTNFNPYFSNITFLYTKFKAQLKSFAGGGIIDVYCHGGGGTCATFYSHRTLKTTCIPTSLNCEEFNVTSEAGCFGAFSTFLNNKVFPDFNNQSPSFQKMYTLTDFPEYETGLASCYGGQNIEEMEVDQYLISYDETPDANISGCGSLNFKDIDGAIPITSIAKIITYYTSTQSLDPNATDLYQGINVELLLHTGEVTIASVYSISITDPCNLNLSVCNTEITVNFDDIKNDCIDDLMAEAEYNAIQLYQSQIDAFSSQFITEYYSKCFASPFDENLQYTYTSNEYHYTLYYYDQAKNLVQTVPPQGVNLLAMDAANFGIEDPNQDGNPIDDIVNGIWSGTDPSHTYITHYKYNSFNQLVKQETPDAGISNFIYNDKTQLVYSQNFKQKVLGKASYTVYDVLGRISEVGENTIPVPMTELSLPTNIPAPGGTQVTKTYYDDIAIAAVQPEFTYGQQNLRNRVASTAYYDDFSSGNYVSASHYSYDTHGNVNELVQENNLLANITGTVYKKIDYEYDLISGNVNKVNYQEGKPDQFYHRYCYDADNRILNTETSNNRYIWENDATYFYYLHGPLARVEIGHDKVQAIDYAYTIQGWLKGINSESLMASRDIGKDGNIANSTNLNKHIAKDAYAFQLGYFYGDYASIINQGTNNFYGDIPAAAVTDINLYNGNIASMSTSLTDQNEIQLEVMGYSYKYDQLNRIKMMTAYNNLDITNNTWASYNPLAKYATNYSYDANGNISSLNRKGDITLNMDDLTYHYYSKDGMQIYTTPPSPTTEMSNKLAFVEDNYGFTNQNDYVGGDASTRYEYDEIGNLTKDPTEAIENIEWTVYGKIKKITRDAVNAGNMPDLEFVYDPSGNRITKIVKPKGSTQASWEYYNYARDAQGNEMGIYKTTFTGASSNYNAITELTETPIYGSSRLGIKNYDALLVDNTAFSISGFSNNYFSVTNTTPYSPPTINPNVLSYYRELDHKKYELSNHLGNVLTVINDRKLLNPDYANQVNEDFDDAARFANEVNDVFIGSAPCVGCTDWMGYNSPNKTNVSYNNGRIRCDENQNVNGIFYGLTVTFPTVLNTKYHVSFDYDADNSQTFSYGAAVRVGSANGSQIFGAFFNGNTVEFDFIAQGTLHVLNIFAINPTSTPGYSGKNHFYVDNVKISDGTEYTADIQSYADYYAFGSLLPGRHSGSENYRYGFGGHEKDDEVKGNGNHYVFGDFGYDTRLGRRWNVDPAISEFPQWSSYSVFADNPIYFIDPDGRKFINFDANGNYTGTTKDNKWHNFWHGSKGRQTLADGGVNKFKFADPKNDVADIQSGRITKLITVKESQVKNMLIVAGAFNAANRSEPATFLGGAGIGNGAFDFSFTGIPKEFGISAPVKDANGDYNAPNIFLVDGVAHNHMNFGNFMFGAGGATLGVYLAALKLGAHKNSRFPEDGQGNRMGDDNLNGYTPQWDSSDDQFSIGEGYNFARGGGLLNRTFGGGRAWDKKKLEGNVEAGPLEGGTVVE